MLAVGTVPVTHLDDGLCIHVLKIIAQFSVEGVAQIAVLVIHDELATLLLGLVAQIMIPGDTEASHNFTRLILGDVCREKVSDFGGFSLVLHLVFQLVDKDIFGIALLGLSAKTMQCYHGHAHHHDSNYSLVHSFQY